MVNRAQLASGASFCLALLVTYQVYYYSLGLLAMECKYWGMHFWLANVLSLLPAIWLSNHTVQRLSHAAEEKPIWRKIAYAYMIIALVELAAYIYGYMPQTHMQLEPQRIISFQKALHWWVYYFGVLVFTPAQGIAVIALLTEKWAPAPAEEKKGEQSAALVYSQQVQFDYNPNHMV